MGVALRTTPAQAVDVGGHKRGELPSEALPRVPVIGIDSGCIPGTRPGCSAAELERAGRDIVRARLSRRRFRPA